MANKTIIIELTHPKHYHQFKYIINLLKQNNVAVHVVARDKDILLKLLDEEKVDYRIYGHYSKNILGKIFSLPLILKSYSKIIKQLNPAIILSKASPYSLILKKVFNYKTVIFPDSEIVALTNKLIAPYSDMVITPGNFAIDFGIRHKRINGLFEDSYLHPDYFTPNPAVFDTLGIDVSEKFVLIRFVSWNANHDLNQAGLSIAEKVNLVLTLSKTSKVFVTSESELPAEIKEFKLNAPKNLIHSILYYASLYIGDSQTMASEAALLGTPAIRSNSFVGDNDMSNFIMLEKKWSMLFNVKNSSEIFSLSTRLLVDDSIKSEWQGKRKEYYLEIGDVNRAMTSLILDHMKG
jgi:predicted glycosyltransferase